MDRIYITENLSSIIDCLEPYKSIALVVDGNLISGQSQQDADSKTPVQALVDKLSQRWPMKVLDISEAAKSMDTVLDLTSFFLENGLDRSSLVLAIGGGITTDIAGFAAAIYMRGIKCAYVPTTFLAQVDAAIGGKTGVNFAGCKNILGIIRQPEFTFISSEVLDTLPRRDFLSGAAELLKTFIIEDGGNYIKAITTLHQIASLEGKVSTPELKQKLTTLIANAAKVKAGVVSRDLYESGERRHLNLGHTFAHAIEALAHKKDISISHGEAVAMGIILAARLSDSLYSTELETVLVEDFAKAGLVTDCPFTIEEMAAYMKKDKKAEGDIVHFVLIESIGKTVIEDMTVEKAVELLKK